MINKAAEGAVKPLFTIVKNRRAWWPVTFSLAAEDGGEVEERTIEMRFRVVEVDEASELTRAAHQIDDVDGESRPSVRYATFVANFADDWRGVGAENGQPLPWSAENLAALMNVPGLFNATMSAFHDCLAGRREAREKN